jgi:uncharacterized NAD-dependent epimerase/dehydratase family protein
MIDMILLQDLYEHTNAIILAHGYVGEILGKTIHGILMHSRVFNILALVDKNKTGQDTSKICPGVTKVVPIYDNIGDALLHNPKVMILIGDPSEKNTDEIKSCILKGLDIINSSFLFLKDFPDLVALASAYNVKLIDLRDVQKVWKNPEGSIDNIRAKVVYVTGTDCGLGKRTAAYELSQEAKKRGIHAGFAATGQTGIMIGCDGGIVFDAISTNFAASAVEQLIVDMDDRGFELIFLEGQGSILHYACSSSIALLHASNPHAIVLAHDPSRKFHAAFCNSPVFKMCELKREIEVIENLYLPGGNKYKVVAVPTWSEKNIAQVKALTGLPVADVRKNEGPALILDAILKHLEKSFNWFPAFPVFNS